MAITINGSGITSSEIADGTITNADINASAGIAGSKLTDIKTVNGDSLIGSGDLTVGGGKVLQVVSGVTDQSDWVNSLVGTSILHVHTFTPLSATSNVLIMASIGAEKVYGSSGIITNHGYLYPHIYSGSTAVQRIGNAFLHNTPTQARLYCSSARLEASGSTGSRTYSIRAHTVSGGSSTRFLFYDATMTIIEVEA